MLESFQSRNYGHVFDDPFSSAFQQTVNRLMSLADQHGVFRGVESFTPIYTKLFNLRDVKVVIPAEDRLKGWLDYLTQLLPVIDETLELLRKSLKRARSDYRIDALNSVIEYCETADGELREFSKNVSRTHMMLQHHFILVTIRGVRRNQLENIRRASFFAELYNLRDSYFCSPDPQTLNAYVREYERLIQEPYYSEEVAIRLEDEQLDEATAEDLAEATAKLDVACLVELVA